MSFLSVCLFLHEQNLFYFLKRLLLSWQVIFFTDPVDEYLMQYLMDYEDKQFQNVSKEGLKLGKDSKNKDISESFKDLTKWWKTVLSSENVDSVKISNRLDQTPCIVVTSKYGWSANMERIMQSQTLSDANKQAYMRGKRVLEINPRHPIIKELRERLVKDPEVIINSSSTIINYCFIFWIPNLFMFISSSPKANVIFFG